MDPLVPESRKPVSILIFVLKGVEEVVVCQRGVMEQVDEQKVVINENTWDERVWEIVDGHSMVVHVQLLINVQFPPLDSVWVSVLLPEDSDPEPAVIEIGDGKLSSLGILLNLFELNVTGLSITDPLLECVDVGF